MYKEIYLRIFFVVFSFAIQACQKTTAIEDFRIVAIGDVPQEKITEISEALEEHRARIVENFGVTDLPTITVKIWQDRPAFETAYGEDAEYAQGYVDIENWEVRIFNGRPTLGLSTVHEFTHLVTVALNPTIANNPRWLWEATAIYESSRPPVPDPTNLGCISPSMFPTLDELETHPFNVYRMGYFLTEYIVANCGQEGLNRLIQSNGNIQESLKITKEKFKHDWLEYMLSEYDLQYLEDANKNC